MCILQCQKVQNNWHIICKEKFEDTKVVIRSPKSKRDRQPNDTKMIEGQTTIYKILHRGLMIE